MTGSRPILFALLLLGAALLPAGTVAGEEPPLRECDQCPELVVIPAGRFLMGSPEDEPGRFDTEGPRHAVTLPAFALGKYDVTVGEFAAFVRETDYQAGACTWPPDTFWQSPTMVRSERQPVVCVSWRDAQAYLAWLNGKVRHGAKGGDGPYRLPSEAEWEYAARGGTAAARWWGEEIGLGNANCNGCGSAWDNRQIAPVGSFAANPFGLFDMLGNVWQWTADCWNDSYDGAPADGRAWSSGDCGRRVLRGGSWSNLPRFLRTASRSSGGTEDRDHDYASYSGFRVARKVP